MHRILIVVAVALTVAVPAARAQDTAAPAAGPSLPEAGGRFTMTPVDGGVLRLDTRTGSLSRCSARSGSWACELLPDDRAAYEAEIGRLNERIATLETRIAREAPRPPAGVPDIMAEPEKPAPPDSGEQAGPRAAPDAGAPTDEESVRRRIDRGVDMAEHMFRRFMQMIERLRKDEEAL